MYIRFASASFLVIETCLIIETPGPAPRALSLCHRDEVVAHGDDSFLDAMLTQLEQETGVNLQVRGL